MELFEKYGVFSHREMHSRYEIGLEQYALSVGVEARSTLEIGDDGRSCRRRSATRPSWRSTSARSRRPASRPTPPPLDEVSAPIGDLRAALADAARGARRTTHGDDALAEAEHARDALLPAMAAVRVGGRRARGHRGRRPVAAADLPGDALHPVAGTRMDASSVRDVLPLPAGPEDARRPRDEHIPIVADELILELLDGPPAKPPPSESTNDRARRELIAHPGQWMVLKTRLRLTEASARQLSRSFLRSKPARLDDRATGRFDARAFARDSVWLVAAVYEPGD